MSVIVQPFPWDSLEAMGPAAVRTMREVRRWVSRSVELDAFGRALTEVVGTPVRLIDARPARAGRGFEAGIGIALSSGCDAAGALLEVEAALAVALVGRVLKRPGVAAMNLAAPPSAALAGAVAAVVAAAARRAHVMAAPLRVLASSAGLESALVRAASGLEAGPAGAGAEALAVELTVLVGDDAYAARLALHHRAAWAAPPAEWTGRSLASLGNLPLTLPIVACATPARVADVGALRTGDAWLPGRWPLELVREGDAASLRGPVILAAPGAAAGVRAQLVGEGRLVLSGDVDAMCGEETDMTERDGESTLLDAVGDVPVVVRVEIGEARMAAREWAALGRGDVITVGRRVGELVLLRVGGVPVARGELVNVDGEVGVRIAERLGGETTRA